MPGLLYFLSGQSGEVSPELVDAHGLGYAFEGPLAGCRCFAGPDGQAGLVVADPRHVSPDAIGFHKDRQEWIRAAGPVFVGRYRDQATTPENLARREQLGGHRVTLGDRQAWLVPMARAHVEEDGELRWTHALARRLTRDDAGRWRAGDVVPRLAWLWDHAVRWDEALDAAIAGAEPNDPRTELVVRFDRYVETAIEVLAANYRLGPAETDLLGLFTYESTGVFLCPEARAVLDALADRPTLVAWHKKKRQASPSPASVSSS